MQKGAERSSAPEYKLYKFSDMDGAIAHILKYVEAKSRAGRGENFIYNNAIFTADTETSKTRPDAYDSKGNYIPAENIVVAWTFSCRIESGNVCTVYGSRPSEFCIFLSALQDALPGEKTFIFYHNLSYDWVFLELFLFQFFGYPVNQLNTKPHYPISIEFDNGVILRDSYIIAQQSLERWSSELSVEHQKAVDNWDYDAIRDQSGRFSAEEMKYIEYDTLALAECLDKLRAQLHKHVYSIPMTCTGIIRELTRKEGRRNRARDRFLRFAPCYELYTEKLLPCYHGGYTHNNRHAAGWIWPDNDDLPTCYDFSSSYPFRMLVDKFPIERFRKTDDKLSADEIIKHSEDTAFIFNLYAEGVELRDPLEPMPVLQLSKCQKSVNAITDNGRILRAEAVDIVLSDVDLRLIRKQYKFKAHVCYGVWIARKGYLPRWFRDLVYHCFEDKTMLKGGDPVDYSLAKARLNSLYGMCCQKSIRDEIVEDYKTGDFTIKETADEELYQKYLDNNNSILPYFWGIYVTAYAMEALFELGSCVKKDGIWLYSDTDSVYACGFDMKKLNAYNEKQKERLRAAGYGPVMKADREYWPGIAELDGVYKEFIGLHSKCYAVRKMDGSIKITVAGVPKKGAACLDNDLNNFHDGFVFPGEKTGKLTHYYLYRPEPVVEDGIEKGNSVDLHACDYEIGMPTIFDMLKVFQEEEVEMQVYE